MVRRRYRVRGRVQGVGFRWWVRRCAASLEVAGWVRNLPDGTVQVEALGTPEALGRLADALARGPALAEVEAVEDETPGSTSTIDPDEAVPTGFEIR